MAPEIYSAQRTMKFTGKKQPFTGKMAAGPLEQPYDSVFI